MADSLRIICDLSLIESINEGIGIYFGAFQTHPESVNSISQVPTIPTLFGALTQSLWGQTLMFPWEQPPMLPWGQTLEGTYPWGQTLEWTDPWGQTLEWTYPWGQTLEETDRQEY